MPILPVSDELIAAPSGAEKKRFQFRIEKMNVRWIKTRNVPPACGQKWKNLGWGHNDVIRTNPRIVSHIIQYIKNFVPFATQVVAEHSRPQTS
jgi:hypothetical protein